MKTNGHNEAIPENLISAMENAISEQLKALIPYATPLTMDDRRDLLKMGPKTFKFVELASTLSGQNPQLLSNFFDIKGFDADWADTHNLLALANKIRQLMEMIEDIRMTAGSDALRHALEVYADVKVAAARNIPEARAVYEQLKAAYPVRRRKHREQEAAIPDK